MPDLRKNLSADGMDGLGGQSPSGNLLCGENARIEQVSLPLARYWRALADDQPGGGSLRVVERNALIRDVVAGT
jgi:hypothetical protein